MINSEKLSLFRDGRSSSVGLSDVSLDVSQSAQPRANIPQQFTSPLSLNKEVVTNLLNKGGGGEKAGYTLSIFNWADCGNGPHWKHTRCNRPRPRSTVGPDPVGNDGPCDGAS